MRAHQKETITVTIHRSNKVSFVNHMPTTLKVEMVDPSTKKVVKTVDYQGEIVGRDQFGQKLRLKADNGGVLAFELDRIVSIKQELD